MARRATPRRLVATAFAGAALFGTASAQAAIVAQPPPSGAAAAQAMFANPALLTPGATLVTNPGPASRSVGVSDALGAFPTNGTQFAILSSGLATSADDPNANVPDDASPSDDKQTDYGSSAFSRGPTNHDTTVLRIPFTVPAAANCLTLDFQFLTEEYADFVGQQYNDAFIAELDTSSWTTLPGSGISAPDNFAFDGSGNVVSVNSLGVGGFSLANAAGTTYDGATPRLQASKQVSAGSHNLFLSIFDQGDGILDSSAFVDNIRVGFVPDPAQNCRPGAQVQNFTLDLTPATATRGIGTQHTATATLKDEDGNPVGGEDITFTVAGANPQTSTATTGPDGTAKLTYTGTQVGSDAISATYDADGDNTAEAQQSATVDWENRYALDLTPANATRNTGSSHSVTATVTNDGAAVGAGQPVAFTVTGANPRTATVNTAANGTATLTYVGTAQGVDTISACLEVTGGAPCEAQDTAEVNWVNSPPSCTSVRPSDTTLKFANHKFTPVTVSGATDPDGDPVTLTITTVEQDEAINEKGDGNTGPDAQRVAGKPNTVELRQERSGKGDGRVYIISFTGDDGRGGQCSGSVRVVVPHDNSGRPVVDSGVRFDSFSNG